MMADQDKLENFVERCVWAYVTHRHQKELFEGKESDLRLFEKVSARFFMDLHIILMHYSCIQICSLTDPARSRGEENLTINNLFETINWPIDIKSELREKVKWLMAFRDKIVPARNKIIAHADQKAHFDGKALGGFEKGEDEEFFVVLEESVVLMHGHLIGGPCSNPIRVNNAFEPATELLRKLRSLEKKN